MAESLLSPLLKVVFDKLVALITAEYRLQRGVHKEMEQLRSTLTTIEAVLEDAEEQQVKDKAVKHWLGELKDAAYEADDILDEFMTEVLRRKIESEDRHHMMNKVRNFLSLPLVFHIKMGHKVKKIRERLDAIASERSKVLTICGMDGVKCIDTAFYGNNDTSRFPSLKEATIRDMPNLEEFFLGIEREIVPHLVSLTVVGCPKLAKLPHLPSIKRLWLGQNNETLLRSMANFTSLMSLSIVGFAKLESIEEGLLQNLSHLSNLTISRCPELKYPSRDLKNLPALSSLGIFNCHKLVSLESPTSLHEMVIGFCNGLTSLELGGLTSLRHLQIYQCENLGTFIGEMQHVTSLQSLDIGFCPQLTSLPQGMQLLNLQDLVISCLDKLTSLPDALQNATKLENLIITGCLRLMELPEWMGNLKSLKYFSIQECPHLERRCQKEKGEDWHKIAHFPSIMIGSYG